ncbi:MAG: molybdate ABC transporter substrate-binding protein [Sphingomonas sp.]|nr:MAG: molybdate ABC transporter substrate-binding protein [Sphingomonas sp.]
MRRFLAVLFLLFAAPALAQVPVAAAASLRYALDDAAAAFTRATGEQVRISYAASGNLVQQIEAGAPYQLFLSADEAHVFRLAEKRLAPGRGTVYAVGRLVYITPPGSVLKPDPALASLKAGLTSGQVRRLAIANPETAPYGARTVEALKAAGLWKQAEPRLVTGENIAQAFQFVASGAADAGFTSLSLVKSPGFKGRYALVPAQMHQPLTQRMVLLTNATPPARRFHDWLLSPAGQKILARHGYLPPA